MSVTKSIQNFYHQFKEAVRYPGYSTTGSVSGLYSSSLLDWFNFTSAPALSPTKLAQDVGNMEHIAAVCSINNWVVRRLQEPPLQVCEVRRDGTEEVIYGHPLPILLSNLNDYLDYADFIEEYWWGKTTDGNAYFLVTLNRLGEPAEIWPLPYWLTAPRWENNPRDGRTPFIDFYEYGVNGSFSRYLPAAAILDASEEPEKKAARFGCIPNAYVIHFKNRRHRGRSDSDVNIRKGTPLFAPVIPELAGDAKSVLFQLALLENGGVPKMILSPNSANVILDDKDVKELAAQIHRATTGENAGRILVTGAGMKTDPLSFKPSELNLQGLREVTQNALCQLINVDPSVIKFSAQEKTATKANRKQANEDAAESFLIPEWGLLEKQFYSQLLPLFEPDRNKLVKLRVRFDLTKVRALQEDENAKADRARADMMSGALKVSDYQKRQGLPVDKNADHYYMPQNIQIVTDEVRQAHIAKAGIEVQAAAAMAQQAQKVADAPLPPPTPPAAPARKPKKTLPLEHETKAQHSYATTQIVLPEPEARKAQEFEIDPQDLHEQGRETVSHVTLLYGLHSNDVEAIRRLIGNEPPIRLVFGATDIFEREDFDVVYVSVESEDMERLNRILRDNTPNTTTFADYHPHMTLAYVLPGRGRKYLKPNKLDGVALTTNTVEFRDDNGVKTLIELTGVRAPQ